MSKQKIISYKSNCNKTNLTQISKLPNQLTTPIFSSSNCSKRSLFSYYSFSTIFLSCPESKQDFSNPDEYSLVNSLKKAPPSRCSTHGQQIHSVVIKAGFCRFTVLMTALMDFNLKCGNLKEAEKVFDEMPERDVVSWTCMIVGYSKHHYYAESLSLFRTMISTGAINPSAYSFSGALAACSELQALKQGQQIHAHVLTSGFLGVNLVLQNNLLNMYSRSQSIGNARKLFDLMTTKGNIAWNEMISGCLQCGEGEKVLKLFTAMISQGVKPDKFSYAICADACAGLASMQQGIQIHAHTIKSGFQSDLVVGNALVDMYAKCGCVSYAKLIFDSIPSPDTFLWTAVISAYGKNGQFDEVLTLFELMLGSNAKPDEITFLTVLSACSHGGLIDQGQRYFGLMSEYLIPAGPEHYSCMVDLLCRGGYLCEALEFIKKMPMKPSTSVWTAFLSSCRIYGNTKLAQFAADQFLEENPENQSDLLVLSHMYASGHDWDETEKIRERMRNDSVRKDPGCSWIELKNGIHVFLTGERSHPDIGEILPTLNSLMGTCWKDMKNATLVNFHEVVTI